ncbi:hypothetical protein IE53DRAFT_369993 [Violaceomyces palustris]|uniref:Uncharacterized protein n=1 Tax=Violaceomyces palustris TaxID=1673888 RepID=A0ACD0NTN2_9BASI|nr:hypothetical protein IE53DRAFT_369993 [Violaceomyces palustris]
MPPSWLKSIQDHVAKVPDSLQNANWSTPFSSPSAFNPRNGPGQPSTSISFDEGLLSAFALPAEVSAMAFDPILSFLAIGTALGTVHIFGSPAVQISFTLRPALKIRHLAFKPGSPFLICIDDKDNLSVYDLSRPDPQIRAAQGSTSNQFRTSSASSGSSYTGPPHPDTPARVGVHSIRNKVISIELSPSHSHLFLGLRDGTVDTYDLERFCPSPYRVPNLWWEEEEILRKSGVPDAPNRRHIPIIIDIKTNPRDINQLLLAYEGGAILLDVKERSVIKTYQLRLLPGAPGAGGDPSLIWTERSSPATCLAWRPDGEVFAVGHEDGCISFWHVKEDEKPLMVRTLERVDVDRPSVEPDSQAPSLPKEPIFKLAWSGFPEKTWIDMASEAAAQGAATWQQHQQHPHADERQGKPSENQGATKGTILTVLGGVVPGRDPPGVACLHLPPFAAPMAIWNSSAADHANRLRHSLRQSLEASWMTTYQTDSTVEDFLLLPKGSPHYSGNYDPYAIVMLLAADPRLPTLPPPAASRGLAAFAFPPRFGSPSTLSGDKSLLAESLLPKQLSLPLALTFTGSGAILGAKLENLTPHAYRKLVGRNDVTGQLLNKHAEILASTHLDTSLDDRIENLKLRGGKASPMISGEGAEGIEEISQASKFRILITWHLDGSIRFHDASPHLLLLGKVDAQPSDPEILPRVLLEKSFPSPLPNLTIETRSLLANSSMVGHPTFDRIRERARVNDIMMAPEVLEVAIALSTGQILHYRFDFARLSETTALNEEVEREIAEDQAAVKSLIPPVSPRSPRSIVSVGSRPTMNELDDSMAQAMRELDTGVPPVDYVPPAHSQEEARQPQSVEMARGSSQVSGSISSQGVPPPRPKRDPKRLSLASRLMGGGTKEKGREREGSGSGPTSPRQVISQMSSPSLVSGGSRSSFGGDSITSMQLPVKGMQESQAATPQLNGGEGEELTLLHHLADWHCDGFKPNLLIDPMRGDLSAFAISDIGFISFACGTILGIVDMRGPELILREGFGDDPSRESMTKEVRKIIEQEGHSPISLLSFSICRVAEDASLAPRLIVTRSNGLVTVWTMAKTLDMWLIERTSLVKIEELERPIKTLILDTVGNVCPAIPGELQRSLREQQYGPPTFEADKIPDAHLLLGFSASAIIVRFGVTGPVISKTLIGERALGGAVVERNNAKVAAVVTETSLRVYSLPHLEPIIRLQRHKKDAGERLGVAPNISFDSQGDFVEVSSSLDVRLWTLLASLKRPGIPCLELYDAKATLPPHPGFGAAGVASSIAGWLGGRSQFLNPGSQLDEILAGSNRPEMPKLPEILPPRSVARRQILKRVEGDDNGGSGGSSRMASGRNTPTTSSIAKSQDKAKAVASQADQASSSASMGIDLLKARGAMMNGLEEGLSSLERGASNFVKNTRDMAIKSAAKDKVNKLFF